MTRITRRTASPSLSLQTRFTELVGCSAPIQLAGLGGGIGTPELAVAVARAGGLGLIGHAYSPEEISAVFDAHPDVTPGQLGVNFLVPFLDPAHIDLAGGRARVVDLFYAEPDADLVQRIHDGGALSSWQVGSAEEARAAANAGCDFVIAQGIEAGGHLRGTSTVLALLDEVLGAVDIPVLAAGGIATGQALAAVLAAGADGARIGTRFVASHESGAHEQYVSALLDAGNEATAVTTRFGADWPDAPHRVLAACLEAADAASDETVAELPTARGVLPVGRWSSQPPPRTARGNIGAMAMYAGTAVGTINNVEPAADIVRRLVTEAAQHLDPLHPCT